MPGKMARGEVRWYLGDDGLYRAIATIERLGEPSFGGKPCYSEPRATPGEAMGDALRKAGFEEDE